MTTSESIWNIQQEGRNWASEAELLARDKMIPVGARIEIHNGKLLFNDEDRLTLLAMLLENLGLDAVVSRLEALSEELNQKIIGGENDKSHESSVEADTHAYDIAPSATALIKSLHLDTGKNIDRRNSDKPTLSPSQFFKKTMDDYLKNPVRYVIYSSLENVKFYLNIENDTCSIDLYSATVFKDLLAARAVISIYDDSSHHIAQISINDDDRTILADKCLQSK